MICIADEISAMNSTVILQNASKLLNYSARNQHFLGTAEPGPESRMASLNEPNVQPQQCAQWLSLGKAEEFPDSLMTC